MPSLSQKIFSVTKTDLLFNLFLLLLVLTPIPFGSNRPWASDLCAVLSACLVGGLAWVLFRSPSLIPTRVASRWLVASATLICLCVLWVFVQSVSWTPASWHHPLWDSVLSFSPPAGGAISVDPTLMAGSLARLLCYVSFFLLAFFLGRDAGRAQRMVKILAFAAVAYAVYGLIIQATGSETILWFDKWSYQGYLTSTFVNKNSYATYAGFGFLCCLTLFWQKISVPAPKGLPRRVILASLVEKFGSRDLFYLLMAFTVFGALILTGSRAGFVSLLAGLTAFALGLAINRRVKPMRLALAAFIGLALLGSVLFLGGDQLLERLSTSNVEAEAPLRLSVYTLAGQSILDNPWRGFGLGTFDAAFRLYRDATVQIWVQHAHNDYIEMAMDLGMPAALLLGSSFLLMIGCCLRGIWRRQRGGEFPALGFGVSVLAATHALADFSFHIPAVSLTYAALLGLGVAQSWSSTAQTSASRRRPGR